MTRARRQAYLQVERGTPTAFARELTAQDGVRSTMNAVSLSTRRR